ncbi:MAG: UDPGP type 1 family protein [Gemmataceae bacterium]|nr:UDPGP type 1 family protein [Gemmata sp.]MDW8197484.1 UDPGP type 1 family protein [Gemmataceae bacterium]
MSTPPAELRERLRRHHQDHVLYGWDQLDHTQRAQLVEQLAAIDLAELENLYRQVLTTKNTLPDSLEPVPLTAPTFTAEEKARGEDALRQGQVAVLLVAGGQATRLKTSEPKGMFPVGAVSGATLYQIHAEKVLALSRRYRRPLLFLIMTSPATDAPTRAYFEENNYFGLARTQVRFFQQGTMPAVGADTGQLLLAAPGKLLLSPNGHGGAFTALADSGLLSELMDRGVEHLFYFQVDNPLVKVCDPGFLGRHIATAAEASSKVVIKTDPAEKVGVLVASRGRCAIIEYSLLPPELAAAREAGGELRFRAGSPAIHVFRMTYLQRVTEMAADSLPYRPAFKEVEHFDPQRGDVVKPAGQANAVKFERFIFDALPHAERWLVVPTARAEEFAPIKNAHGPDSPETARAAMIALHTQWLAQAGIDTRGHPVEISPLLALDAEELAEKIHAQTVLLQEKVLHGPHVLR